MAFRFALAPLLGLRRSVEHQCALQLQRAALEVARARETLERIERILAESARADLAGLASGKTGGELQFASLVREKLCQFRLQLVEEIVRLEAARQEAARTYQTAFEEREALESLREHHRRAYQLEQARREQRELDSAFLLRRWDRKDG